DSFFPFPWRVRAMLRYSVALAVIACFAVSARADTVTATYTELPNGTSIDLTATGGLDWVKWGNTTTPFVLGFATVEKVGGSVINPGLAPLGTAPPGSSVTFASFSGAGNMKFTWSNGTAAMAGGGPVDTGVTETLVPFANSYPIGIGAVFTANASATSRVLDVYVSGFDANILLTAALGSGPMTS